MSDQLQLLLAARKALNMALARTEMIGHGYLTADDLGVVTAHLTAARAALTAALREESALVEKVGLEEVY